MGSTSLELSGNATYYANYSQRLAVYYPTSTSACDNNSSSLNI